MRPEEDSATVLGRIRFTTRLEDLADVDFVVENVPEKWEIKSGIYPQIDTICPQHAVFAVNTSCYSITRVGALTKRPDRMIGMHFMNPVPLKPMVEAIRGHHTSEETIETARQFLRQMGKDCILVNDMPGFVTNRVLMLTINEAVYVLQDGVATAEQVDQIFKTCFGHKMGPLETADLIGLDTILYSIEVALRELQRQQVPPLPAAQEDGRRRPPRPQERQGLLRLRHPL